MMEIKVLGSGCSRCHKTLEIVNKVVSEYHVDANVEYVTDMMRIMEYNVMSMPAIVIDGVVRVKGAVPSESEVKQLLGV
jgi:small redox-active disulfide protein 2